jgi:hypothetical protein
MKYYENVGAIYDVSAFLTNYFEASAAETDDHAVNSAELQYYNEIKNTFCNLPTSLHPFVYSNGENQKSYLASVILRIPMCGANLKQLIEFISGECFLSNFILYWFPEYSENPPKSIEDLKKFNLYSLIEKLTVPEVIKYRLLNVFMDYTAVINGLVIWICKIHNAVASLRSGYSTLIEDCVSEIVKTDCILSIS